jgi:transcriptional regulator with XRE-family HTH domain
LAEFFSSIDYTVDKSLVGAALRRLRKERKLTLRDVAQVAGVTHSYVALLEKGKSNVTLDTLVSVTRAMGGRLMITVRPDTDVLIVPDHDEIVARLTKVLPVASAASRWALAAWIGELERRDAASGSRA